MVQEVINVLVIKDAAPIIESANKNLIEYSILFYPQIKSGKMSYSQVAEKLGVNRLELIDYLGDQGFEYVSCTEEELLHDIEAAKKWSGR